MRADWKADARYYIADATKELPADATLKQRRSALRKVASKFHMGTKWGKKVWSREVRRYLEQHGLPPIRPDTASPYSKMRQRLEAGEITFPFRSAP